MKDKWNNIVFKISKYYFIGMIILTFLFATQGIGFVYRFILVQVVALLSIMAFLAYSEIDIKLILIKFFFLYGIIHHVIPIALPLWIDVPRYVFFDTTVEELVVIDDVIVGFGFTSAYVDGQRHMILDFEDKYPVDELVTIVYLPYSKIIVDTKPFP